MIPLLLDFANRYKFHFLTALILFLCGDKLIAQSMIPVSVGIFTDSNFVRMSNSKLAFPLPQQGTILQVINGGTANARVQIDSYYGGGVQGAAFSGRRTRGTILSPQPPQSNDILCVLNGMGYGVDSMPLTSSGSIAIRAENTFTNTSKPTFIDFLVAPAGSTVNVTKMQLSSAGLLKLSSYGAGILQTDASGNATSASLTEAQVNTALGFTPASSSDYNGLSTRITNDSANLKNNYFLSSGFTKAAIVALGLLATSDTSAMLAPYLRSNVAAATYYPISSNPSGYLTTVTNGQVISALGLSPVNQAGARGAITLTTTGSGAASYNSTSGVLNVPTNTGSTYTAGTGISIASNVVTNTLPFSPTPDTLSAARSFNTSYTMSSTKYVEVCISAQVSASLSLTGGQGGTITLQTSPTGSVWSDKGSIVGSNTGALTIGLSTVQITGGQVCTMLPPTYYYRMATTNNTGTPTFTNLTGNKTTYN